MSRHRTIASLLVALALAVLLGVPFAAALPGGVRAAPAPDFPAGYTGYHTYAEMVDEIDQAVADHPKIVAKQSIGLSHEGRPIWAVKISDHVDVDEAEPEVLFEALHHAREHLTAEMALHLIELLTDNYRAKAQNITTELQARVSAIVKSREIWIVPMVNPDGGEYDISDPDNGFQHWRRNMQPIVAGKPYGIDLNRNWDFKWGCCGGSSGTVGASTYRGQQPWQAPEVRALRDFVLSRRVGGVQQITAAISWHTFNEQVMWPYGYTRKDLPRTMTAGDLAALRALGQGIAQRNGYTAQQMSDLYILDGGAADWLYGDQRILALTIEMYPTDKSHVGGFYPPDDVIARETERNDDAVLFFLEQVDCAYRLAGLDDHCGPLNDEFETDRGWTFDPYGTDTATSGRLERGRPLKTSNKAGVKQRKNGYSGRGALVTGAAPGANQNANDVDGGTTSALSVPVRLGGASSSGWRLDFHYTFAHNKKARKADYLRISIDGQELFSVHGAKHNRNAVWTPVSLSLDAFAGRTLRVLVEVSDGGSDSLIEAAVDDMRIYRQ